jgi:hypothetical protein
MLLKRGSGEQSKQAQTSGTMRRSSCSSLVKFAAAVRQLVQQRFPVGRHPSCGSRNGLTSWMRMRRKQLRTLDLSPRLVVVEPVLARLKAGDDRMSRLCRMFGCVLARGTVAATDVPTLGTAAEVKPPTIRGRQTFHAPIATWFRSGINSAEIFLHCDFSSDIACQQRVPGASTTFPMTPKLDEQALIYIRRNQPAPN